MEFSQLLNKLKQKQNYLSSLKSLQKQKKSNLYKIAIHIEKFRQSGDDKHLKRINRFRKKECNSDREKFSFLYFISDLFANENLNFFFKNIEKIAPYSAFYEDLLNKYEIDEQKIFQSEVPKKKKIEGHDENGHEHNISRNIDIKNNNILEFRNIPIFVKIIREFDIELIFITHYELQLFENYQKIPGNRFMTKLINYTLRLKQIHKKIIKTEKINIYKQNLYFKKIMIFLDEFKKFLQENLLNPKSFEDFYQDCSTLSNYYKNKRKCFDYRREDNVFLDNLIFLGPFKKNLEINLPEVEILRKKVYEKMRRVMFLPIFFDLADDYVNFDDL